MVEKREKRRERGSGKDVAEDTGYQTGYDTDAGPTSSPKTKAKLRKKTKSRKPPADGYATEDDGYMSSTNNPPALRKTRSKSRFFKLGNRSKSRGAGDDTSPVETPPPPPPPPPAPAFRLPIAARFATTLNLDKDNAVLEPPIGPLGTSRPQSPASTFSSPMKLNTSLSPTNRFNEDVESVVGAPEPSIITTSTAATTSPSTTSPTKRAIIRFASDSASSDNHGTSSSTSGHSLLSRFTNTSSSSASTHSGSLPTVKSLNISYPITRSTSSSPLPPPLPPPSPSHQPTVVSVPDPSSHTSKRTPKPLFIHRIPSDLSLGRIHKFGSRSNSNDNSPSEWSLSPATSPFVVVTPIPSGRSGISLPTLTRSRTTRAVSPAGSIVPSSTEYIIPSSPEYIIPSTEYIIPSPNPSPNLNEAFKPPSSLGHYDLPPPPSPPPTVPLPDVPQTQRRGDDFGAQQRVFLNAASSSLSPNSNPNSRPSSPSNTTPQRGRVSPFPTRPVHPTNGGAAVPMHVSPSHGFESRVRVKRYQDLYAFDPLPTLPPSSTSTFTAGMTTPTATTKKTMTTAPPPRRWHLSKDSGYASSPETVYPSTSTQRRHRARQSTQVGIQVEQPSDDDADGAYSEDEDLRNMLRGFSSVSEQGHQGEAALGRRRSLEVLQNYYYNHAYDMNTSRRPNHPPPPPPRRLSPSPSYSRSRSPHVSEGEQEDDLSDDKSRYTTSDDPHSMYRMNDASYSQARSLADDDPQWSTAYSDDETQSRSSFMDADKSDQARERFVRRIEAMFDENGREVLRRNAMVPPVPKIPADLKGSSSRVWI